MRRWTRALGLATLAGLLAVPASAQSVRLRPAFVTLELDERADAETVAAILGGAFVGPRPVVTPAGSRHRVSPGYALEGQPPPEVVHVEGVHAAVRRAPGEGRYGEVHDALALPVREDADGPHVVVDVEAHVAVLVVTGDGAGAVLPEADASRMGRPLRGPGWRVAHLGPQRSERRRVGVPPGAEVTLLTGYQPIRLRLERGAGEVAVAGAPVDERLALRVTLDGEPVPTRPVQGGRWGYPEEGPHHRLAPAGPVASGAHTVRAELADRESGEVIAWVEGAWNVPVDYALEVTAGLGPSCVTLDRGGLAFPRTVGDLLAYGGVTRVEPGARVDGFYGEGTRVCVSRPFWESASPRRIQPLSYASRVVGARVALTVHALPIALLRAMPIAMALLSLLVLVVGLWPRRRAPVTHLAWARLEDGGYRDAAPPSWTVLPLPDAPTPLHALDDALDGVAHTVAAGDDGRAEVGLAGPAVVAPPPPEPTTTQLSEVSVPPGTVVIDGRLRFALLDAAAATKPEVPTPDPDAIGQARRIGFTTELVVPRPPSRAARALFIGMAVALATTATYLPAFLGRGTPFEEPAGTVWAWLAMAVGTLAVLVGVVVAERRRGGGR